MPWQVDIYEGYATSMPQDEIWRHDKVVWSRIREDGFEEFVSQCECNPKIIYEEGNVPLISHRSFDGREGLEEANEILKQK